MLEFDPSSPVWSWYQNANPTRLQQREETEDWPPARRSALEVWRRHQQDDEPEEGFLEEIEEAKFEHLDDDLPHRVRAMQARFGFHSVLAQTNLILAAVLPASHNHRVDLAHGIRLWQRCVRIATTRLSHLTDLGFCLRVLELVSDARWMPTRDEETLSNKGGEEGEEEKAAKGDEEEQVDGRTTNFVSSLATRQDWTCASLAEFVTAMAEEVGKVGVKVGRVALGKGKHRLARPVHTQPTDTTWLDLHNATLILEDTTTLRTQAALRLEPLPYRGIKVGIRTNSGFEVTARLVKDAIGPTPLQLKLYPLHALDYLGEPARFCLLPALRWATVFSSKCIQKTFDLFNVAGGEEPPQFRLLWSQTVDRAARLTLGLEPNDDRKTSRKRRRDHPGDLLVELSQESRVRRERLETLSWEKQMQRHRTESQSPPLDAVAHAWLERLQEIRRETNES